ncbi:UNKNOWN [Stylonychia lemnae]|uniref:Uncharacterized protein n=1 Tax=Stylonychia lemnae TaxID=5949 RepID=A0A078AY35_STYLE|nr:UNKNOWN [Stylonychia lemnae]|eukprot:CDW85703.1 UNKNOWN [Stylonychia lemnae]
MNDEYVQQQLHQYSKKVAQLSLNEPQRDVNTSRSKSRDLSANSRYKSNIFENNRKNTDRSSQINSNQSRYNENRNKSNLSLPLQNMNAQNRVESEGDSPMKHQSSQLSIFSQLNNIIQTQNDYQDKTILNTVTTFNTRNDPSNMVFGNESYLSSIRATQNNKSISPILEEREMRKGTYQQENYKFKNIFNFNKNRQSSKSPLNKSGHDWQGDLSIQFNQEFPSDRERNTENQNIDDDEEVKVNYQIQVQSDFLSDTLGNERNSNLPLSQTSKDDKAPWNFSANIRQNQNLNQHSEIHNLKEQQPQTLQINQIYDQIPKLEILSDIRAQTGLGSNGSQLRKSARKLEPEEVYEDMKILESQKESEQQSKETEIDQQKEIDKDHKQSIQNKNVISSKKQSDILAAFQCIAENERSKSPVTRNNNAGPEQLKNKNDEPLNGDLSSQLNNILRVNQPKVEVEQEKSFQKQNEQEKQHQKTGKLQDLFQSQTNSLDFILTPIDHSDIVTITPTPTQNLNSNGNPNEFVVQEIESQIVQDFDGKDSNLMADQSPFQVRESFHETSRGFADTLQQEVMVTAQFHDNDRVSIPTLQNAMDNNASFRGDLNYEDFQKDLVNSQRQINNQMEYLTSQSFEQGKPESERQQKQNFQIIGKHQNASRFQEEIKQQSQDGSSSKHSVQLNNIDKNRQTEEQTVANMIFKELFDVDLVDSQNNKHDQSRYSQQQNFGFNIDTEFDSNNQHQLRMSDRDQSLEILSSALSAANLEMLQIIEEYVDQELIVPVLNAESLTILEDALNERQIQMRIVNRSILEPTLQEELVKLITEVYSQVQDEQRQEQEKMKRFSTFNDSRNIEVVCNNSPQNRHSFNMQAPRQMHDLKEEPQYQQYTEDSPQMKKLRDKQIEINVYQGQELNSTSSFGSPMIKNKKQMSMMKKISNPLMNSDQYHFNQFLKETNKNSTINNIKASPDSFGKNKALVTNFYSTGVHQSQDFRQESRFDQNNTLNDSPEIQNITEDINNYDTRDQNVEDDEDTEDDPNIVISSEEDDEEGNKTVTQANYGQNYDRASNSKSFISQNTRKMKRAMRSHNQISNTGVRKFQHHRGASILQLDESPFIYLTTNPLYLDLLCANCYECVRFADVDHHSLVCQSVQDLTTSEKERYKNVQDSSSYSDKINFGVDKELRKILSGSQISSQREIDHETDLSIINERISKLNSAIKNRIVEIQLQDRDNPLTDYYSSIYSVGNRIVGIDDVSNQTHNNIQDPNNLVIIQKILEDYLKEIQDLQRTKERQNQRVVSLLMFTQRLIILCKEKLLLLVKQSSFSNEIIFQTNDNDVSLINLCIIKVDIQKSNTKQKKRALFILNDIRSEINSEKFRDDQSDVSIICIQIAIQYSEYSALSQNNFIFSAGPSFHQSKQQLRSQNSVKSNNNRSFQNDQNFWNHIEQQPNYQNFNQNIKGSLAAPGGLSNVSSPFRKNSINSGFNFSNNNGASQSMITTPNSRSNHKNSVPRRERFNEGSLLSPSHSHLSGSNIKEDINSNLKKHFYSLVIDQLGSYGGRLPDGLSFATLYREAEAEDINIDDWDSYIRLRLEAHRASKKR